MYQISKLYKKTKQFKYILHSIYFNFHYLPIKQAIRLPIILYKPELLSLKGKIIIESNDIHFGMIRLGFRNVGIYPNTGITYENRVGTIIFKGKCFIGNSSAISIEKKAELEI